MYDYHTQTLYKVDPLIVNGEIATYHAEAIAHIDYEANSFRSVTSDFFFT